MSAPRTRRLVLRIPEPVDGLCSDVCRLYEVRRSGSGAPRPYCAALLDAPHEIKLRPGRRCPWGRKGGRRG